MNASSVFDVIGGSELFKGLDRSYTEKIVSLCKTQVYKTGEYIFSQGDFGEHLYVIARGQVFLERSMDLSGRKGNAVIGVLGKGRVLGCWSTLLGAPHNLMSSSVCQKQTEVMFLKGSVLREMMILDREFGFTLLERLCFLLRDRIQGALGAMEKI